jgi:hypothetical protein
MNCRRAILATPCGLQAILPMVPVDEARNLDRDSGVQHMPQSFDIGAEQRLRIGQPGAYPPHSGTPRCTPASPRERAIIEDVAKSAFNLQIVDAQCVGVLAHHRPHRVTLLNQ